MHPLIMLQGMVDLNIMPVLTKYCLKVTRLKYGGMLKLLPNGIA